MKKLSILIIFLSATITLSIAQDSYTSELNIKWEQRNFENIHNREGALTYQGFDGEAFDALQPNKVRLIHHLPLPGNGDLVIKIKPIKTSSIDILEQKGDIGFQDDWEVDYLVTQSGSNYDANISIVPIRKTNSGFEKLESFKLVASYSPKLMSTTRDPGMSENSVLSSGKIYKIAIPNEGVYKISGDFLSGELGIDLNTINTNNLQLYGNIGGRLPQNTSADQPDDLSEIPLKLEVGGDGKISSDEFFLFYADGPDKWSFDSEISGYTHQKNVYDKNNFVFLKIDGSAGKRVQSINSTGTADYESEEFDFLQIYEDERTNLLGTYSSTEGTGKDWYGEYFALETTQSFENKFDISDLATGGISTISMNFAARGETSTKVNLTVNNEEFKKTANGVSLSDIESQYAYNVRFREDVSLSNGSNNIEVEFVKSSSPDEGWLDYIQLEYRKKITNKYEQLRISDSKSLTFNKASLAVPTSGYTVWDVTDINNTSIISPQNNKIIYTSGGELKTFYYVDATNYLVPVAIGEITNQNLHSIQNVDFVIVYHPDFIEAAERLAEHRRSHNGYVVETVDVTKVYNEYSSGRVDPTGIRDFARMLHVRDDGFKYMLLLGDGTYDYRGLSPNLSDHNFIPVYETDESLHPIEGFPSDDYYSLLSDEEGENKLRGGLDIAVGRIPVTTGEMANDVIDKVINYDINKASYGDWRLRIAFAADDEDNNLHVNQADELAESVEAAYPIYNQSKVYFDSYVQESTPGGDRYPAASDAINTAIQKGALILNYMGHGGPKGWSQERVLKISDISTWNNPDHLPILITATCSFTGYDDPALVSAGEEAIQKANGGVVALFTTVRAVYASANKRLAKAVFDQIFKKIDGRAQTIGEIMTTAKNNTTNPSNVTNDRKFALIGDPSQTIAIPTFNVVTTEVNGQSVSSIDTISALEKVTIKGMVTNENGSILSDFNGTVYPTIFDKKSNLETLANDPKSNVKQFGVYRNILFKGSASVTNGEFEFTFVMPKDINYEFGSGRISYYAYDGGNRDAAGNFNNIIVGGTDPNAVADDVGPELELYMNDEKFVFGGTTNENPILLVNLNDDLGINVSGTSIGHDITAILDDDNKNTYILNEFYEANVDDYTSGKVRFPLKGIETGKHSLVVKAWDVSNNSAEERIEFTVVDQEGEELRNVYNYPNPFSTNTSFMFEHDLVGSDLEVYVDIYTVSGKLIKTIEQNVFSSGYRVDDVKWDAKDDYGSGIAKGLYLYKIKVVSRELNQYRESDFEKLVIL
ncbi:MAG: hypothetical protein ACJA1A_000914 [Saprospiraceae bacterium]|jgi:hypothetical protein